MPIECKICLKVLEKQITNTHLKQHQITADEYKNLYGKDSLTSAEYREYLGSIRSGSNNPSYGKKWSNTRKQLMSELKKGNIPWNKGKKIEATEKFKKGIENRERRYRSGDLTRKSKKMSEETKQKISISVSEYAEKNKDEIKERARRVVENKKSKNYDFGSAMRGKKHSKETKLLLSTISKETNKKKTTESILKLRKNAADINCEISKIEENRVEVKCLACTNNFSITKQYFTDSKLRSDLCVYCFPKNQQKRSNAEIELYEFVKSLEPNTKSNITGIIGKSEIDIFVPDKNIAIEYNGLYWHSEQILESIGKSKHRDNNKRLRLREKGIQYIGIFEDEWQNNKEIVKSRIKNILNQTASVIFARRCEIKEIDSKTASKFCARYHIQGKGRSNFRLGLFYQNELVSVMTFSTNNLSRKIKNWEINRFCSKLNTHVVGGASKLFSYFIKTCNPAEVISYSDNRWSAGNLYLKLGFVFVSETPPNYWYFLPNETKRIHRFALRKKEDDPKKLSEKQIRDRQGFYRIWDCGSTKWIWTNKNGA